MSTVSYVDQLHRVLVGQLEASFSSVSLTRARLQEMAEAVLRDKFSNLSDAERVLTVSKVLDRMLGWGPLTSLLADQTITEIMVNGLQSLYVERAGRLEKLENCFSSEEEILHLINRMVGPLGRRIDTSSPLVDARLPDGSRVNAIIPPLSLAGPVLTIRRFPAKPLSLAELVSRQTLSQAMADFLATAIKEKRNIVISGGTGSGKTTTLNALGSSISEQERIITIEDAAEIRLHHPHLISLEARPPNLEGRGEIPVRLLLKNALRMRPDRIIVGEIRGGEALDMLQAMNTGHQGSLTTVHANAPLEALLRIETMTLMAEVELPLPAIRQQIRQALHLIVQQERLADGTRKVVSIQELTGKGQDLMSQGYKLRPLFIFDKALCQWSRC